LTKIAWLTGTAGTREDDDQEAKGVVEDILLSPLL
jgi:hypothetical protein